MAISLLHFVVSERREVKPLLQRSVFGAGGGSGIAGQAIPGHRVKTHAEDHEDQRQRRDAAEKAATRRAAPILDETVDSLDCELSMGKGRADRLCAERP